MKKYFSLLMVLCGVMILTGHAWALSITPDTTPTWTGSETANMSASEIAAKVGFSGTLEELYKIDVDDMQESGSFASSYSTVFDRTPDDPQDATISYISGAYITGNPLYLYVKDGNSTPAYYIFDITAWNGQDTIELTGFWPQRGAISHLTILGVTAVPEPAALILLGLGLLGIAGIRKMKS